jgi:alkylation response protein AidB-like acyl-CoA dehydrogenase
MRFILSSEQQEFARTLRDLLNAAGTPGIARSWAAGDCAAGRKLWLQLADLGVTSLGRFSEGAHPLDLVVGFTELGRAAVPGPFVESVAVLAAVFGDLDPQVMSTLAAPPAVPYACDGAVADVVYVLEGGSLHRGTAGSLRSSVDPARRLTDVTAGDVVAEGVDSQRAYDLGALATAAQIYGAGRAALDVTVTYAKQRTQFGRPIGSFQAVKHQLADAYVLLELAAPLLYGAALAVAAGGPDVARDVSAAKVACTDAAYRAARAALQVHGAIGYTAEYDLSLWLTKIRALTAAWGTQAQHRSRVWEALRG